MKLINLILLASVVSANGVKITDDLPVLPFDELLRLAYQNASEEIKQSHFTENHRRAFDESNDITKRHSVDLFRRADPIPVVFNCLAATGTTFVVAGITVANSAFFVGLEQLEPFQLFSNTPAGTYLSEIYPPPASTGFDITGIQPE
ncbi:uncharacterized protein SETTUDRAFT_20835 [Exserohilum turcica Et28A]|uniref:Uncharacterized protein n=1 Tax=Exserohilum turcicum (strain 28A) TaxID=671987 RepID=R0IJK2_EXST2|nr:uncharacterized protein SETTUDRAFT_20835 [Exserohilum turcica Et28A]EOA85325.1 hypothetical protein SETTUDRAFT_20835 [Exserohilum turcica Et28A]